MKFEIGDKVVYTLDTRYKGVIVRILKVDDENTLVRVEWDEINEQVDCFMLSGWTESDKIEYQLESLRDNKLKTLL